MRILLNLLLILSFVSPLYAAGKIQPYDTTVEYMNDPIGIDVAQPRLSWKSKAVDPESKNLTQTAYQILVASSRENLDVDNGDLWDSGEVESDQSLNIVYAGKPLTSSQRCFWKVRVRDNQSNTFSRYSAPSKWIMGIMNPGDWKAKWVSLPENLRPDYPMDGAKWIWTGETARLFDAPQGERFYHKEFTVPENIEYDRAVLALTADDAYEVDLNGKRATQTWGMFNDWSWLRMIDVKKDLQPGKNTILVKVTNKEPGPTALLLKLDLVKDDQTVATVLLSDKTWTGSEKKESAQKPVVEVGDVDCHPWGKIKRTVSKVQYAFVMPFELKNRSGIKEATLHITGLGYYEVGFGENGPTKKTGNKVLDPIPTRYDRRVLYSTYDVTDEVQSGNNYMFVQLGHGWYDVQSVAVWNYDNAPWRDFPRFISQLEVTFNDGEKATVVSDKNCLSFPGFYNFDCIRQGVVADHRVRDTDWRQENIFLAEVVPAPKGVLSAENMPGSVITDELKPVKITERKPGVYLVDFGQNIGGWVRIAYKGATEKSVVLKYTERLDENGNATLDPIEQHFRHGRWNWFQNDEILTDGKLDEPFEAKFVYHGFQYVEITGLKSAPTPEEVTACVVCTDFKSAGKFECSNELFNKIQNATLWAYKGNYVNGYPTDCPHREKNGWTGDAQLAVEQAQFNWQNTAAYEKWMQDFRDEQRPDGNLPGIVPTSGWGYDWGNGPAWDSAFLIIPWTLYVYQADVRVLERNYDGMKKYVDYMTTRAHENGLVDHGLGDWVFIKTQTPTVVTSSGYFYVDAMILARAAEILGKTDDAEKYAALAEKIRTAYNKELYKGDGLYANGEQAALSCAIHQGLADKSEYEKIGKQLLQAVDKADDHLDFGILGAKYFFRTLSDLGYTDVAYKVANQTTPPSYGAWIERGATTLWEDWKDGDSRNHVMFGDISAWFYQYLAGIRLDESVSVVGQPTDTTAIAFKKFVIAPQPVDGLDWVKAEHDSPYGPIQSSWTKKDGKFVLEVSIPVNTTATVILPGEAEGKSLGSGDYRFEK